MTSSPPTILYLIPDAVPNKTKSDITERLLRTFDVTPLSPWSLEHRLYRSSAPSREVADKNGRITQEWRYLHLLQLHLNNGREGHNGGGEDVAKVCFSSTDVNEKNDAKATEVGAAESKDGEAQMPIVSILSSEANAYSDLINRKMGASWIARSAVYVTGGTCYAVGGDSGSGGFVVRIGEVRQRGGGPGGQPPVRGVVVGIEAVLEDDGGDAVDGLMEEEKKKIDEAEAQFLEETMKALWKDFGNDGAKEFPGAEGSRRDENEVVRQWCHLLRLRG